MQTPFADIVRSTCYARFGAVASPVFSILIPSWNNLPFLRVAVESLRRNSAFPHQIVVHVNDGADGTADWLERERVDHSRTPANAGICYSLNACRALAEADYLVYMNDDMYACPDWDRHLLEEARAIGHDHFYLSGTMIEPRASGNLCALAPHDFGTTPEDFRERELLAEFDSYAMEDYSGTTWPPCLVHRRLWDLVGGHSIEFSPGMYHDPDFAAKLWHAGVRIFKGVGRSRVYHFMSKTTTRIVKNDGRRQFLRKWGMPSSEFTDRVLQRGRPFRGPLPDVDYQPSLAARLKRRLA